MKKQAIAMMIVALVSLMLVGFASATTTCTKTQIVNNFTQGQSPTTSTFQCTNDNNNSAVTLTKSGTFFNLDSTSLGVAPATKTFTVTYDSALVASNYLGTITFSDGSTAIPVSLTVFPINNPTPNPTSSCQIDIFPTVLTNIKIKQGETKTRNIQLTVPQCYPGAVRITGIALQTDEQPIQMGELSLGLIQPGNSILIPIEMNAVGVSTGTYSDTLQFQMYNTSGSRIDVPQVAVSVLVSLGINPISNFSFSQLPSCSLNAVDMNLNNTYKLTCSSPNPNIQIKPLIDTKYVQGVSVTEDSSQYIYDFKPILIGTTQVGAQFLYKNAPIGSPFVQDVRISPSGSTPISGTSLKFNFYQSGGKREVSKLMTGDVTVLVVDDKTDSIVPSFTLYLNGVQTNNSFALKTGETYDLRATAGGYVDGKINFTVSSAGIELKVDPLKEFYEAGDVININATPTGTTFLLNDIVITSPHTLATGEYVLKATKEGYTTASKNISVKSIAAVRAVTPLYEDWKVGKTVTLELTKNATWEVQKDGSVIKSGISNIVEFKLEKSGAYTITADGRVVANQSLESTGLWQTFKDNWYWFLGAIVAIGLIYVLFLRGGGEEKSSMVFDLGKT